MPELAGGKICLNRGEWSTVSKGNITMQIVDMNIKLREAHHMLFVLGDPTSSSHDSLLPLADIIGGKRWTALARGSGLGDRHL